MADVLLSTDDMTVLGGPASISVDLDFGPDGTRGSFWYTNSAGKPTSLLPIENPNIFDMCINTKPGDSEYQYIYQYQNVSGTKTWKKLVRLIPISYSVNIPATFALGESLVNIPVLSIVPPTMIGSVASSSFNVQYSIAGNDEPLATSVSVLPLESVDTVLSLPLLFKSVEFNGTGWVDLAKTVTIHLFITVV
jgi:hypothetical protein